MRIVPALVSLLALGSAHAASSGVQAGIHLQLELLSEQPALSPGASHWLALRIEHEAHWHTYWQVPGDSGLPTRIDWTLPDGFQASGIHWPYPRRLPAGPLTNYGYEGETWLLTELRTPAELPPMDTPVDITAHVSYLVCKEECIPGDAELTLRLPVMNGAPANSMASPRFDRARARLPQASEELGGTVSEIDGDRLRVALTGTLPERFELFPIEEGVFATTAFTGWADDGPARVAVQERSDFYGGLPARLPMLLVDTGEEPARAYRFTLTAGNAVGAGAMDTSAGQSIGTDTSTADRGVGGIGLASALLLAFFGGVVLNLMPCVLPVLSLKALTFGQAGGDHAKARREGLFYTLGVLASFAAIGLVLIALRAGGERIGWGFQLQSPIVVAGLAYLMFLLGLGLSGATTLGSGWMGIGHRLTEGGGDRAAFFTGVLACVVAAPCTAPFMGAALGFAVTQPAAIAMAVFLVLGLGLAAPLAAIALVPALARHLPRPGAWMETFKQILAFPMYLTAVGLLWVLARQTGANGVALALLGMVLVAFAAWLWERGKWRGARMSRATALVSLALALALLPMTQRLGNAEATTSAGQSGSRTWSEQVLSELRAKGEPVLVNMTAAWCITCQVNERVALSSQDFRDRLSRHGIHYLKGDWTRHDPAISDYLDRFDRVGVPLYVLYPRGQGEPEVLPQILTPAAVLAALDQAAGLP